MDIEQRRQILKTAIDRAKASGFSFQTGWGSGNNCGCALAALTKDLVPYYCIPERVKLAMAKLEATHLELDQFVNAFDTMTADDWARHGTDWRKLGAEMHEYCGLPLR